MYRIYAIQRRNFLLILLEKGALLIRKSDPNEFFMKIDETDEGNAVYLDNGEVFRVQPQEPCSPVKYTFTIES